MKTAWRRNLMISWIGCFFTGASMSLVMPFIPLYIESLNAPKGQIELFSGLAVSVTAFAAAIISPIWGNLADRKGRRLMMIRAAGGMTVAMGSLAFVPNVYWLLAMRFLNGLLSGYIPNATALIASQAPEEKSGEALGTLATGAVAGNLIGPSMGGILAEIFGMKNVFIITGTILFITMLLTIFFVKEDFQPVEKADMMPMKEILHRTKSVEILLGLFVTSLILQVGITSISPILTLYIRELSHNTTNLVFISGLIVSASGVSAVVASPALGRLGDRLGSHRVLLIGLFVSLICFIPMGFAQSPLQLGILRFLLGFSTGALMPSINTIISRIAPREGVSRIYSYNQMFNNFGQVLGPMVGSTVAHGLGYRAVFWTTSCFVVFNICLSLVNFRKYLKSDTIG
ncbi:MAG TPA: multidrug efflux MFS transporter [Tetragenococcus sp.]|nr:multidrug efflux MFS transporter [Tetragenococcus sp.]